MIPTLSALQKGRGLRDLEKTFSQLAAITFYLGLTLPVEDILNISGRQQHFFFGRADKIINLTAAAEE